MNIDKRNGIIEQWYSTALGAGGRSSNPATPTHHAKS